MQPRKRGNGRISNQSMAGRGEPATAVLKPAGDPSRMDESGPDKEIDMHEADRRRMQLVAFIAMASVVVGAGGSPETSLTGQARPGGSCPHSPATAEPFATALSDSGRIYRGTFGPAGDELWFFKKVS